MTDVSNDSQGRREVVEGNVPRMRSCRVGKLSELGLCLEALVNTISLGRKMILTLHNRELALSKIPSYTIVFFKSRLSNWVVLL